MNRLALKQYGIISAFTSFLVTDPSDNRPVSALRFTCGHSRSCTVCGAARIRCQTVVGRSHPAVSGSAYTFGGLASVDRLAAAQSDVDFGPYMADLQRKGETQLVPTERQ